MSYERHIALGLMVLLTATARAHTQAGHMAAAFNAHRYRAQLQGVLAEFVMPAFCPLLQTADGSKHIVYYPVYLRLHYILSR